eukprot:SAG11_NODE_399_length_9764_cov_8.760993_10_plen_104_part_01
MAHCVRQCVCVATRAEVCVRGSACDGVCGSVAVRAAVWACGGAPVVVRLLLCAWVLRLCADGCACGCACGCVPAPVPAVVRLRLCACGCAPAAVRLRLCPGGCA